MTPEMKLVGKKKNKKQEKIFRLTEGYDNVMMLWVEFHANSAVETVLYFNLEVYGYWWSPMLFSKSCQ